VGYRVAISSVACPSMPFLASLSFCDDQRHLTVGKPAARKSSAPASSPISPPQKEAEKP